MPPTLTFIYLQKEKGSKNRSNLLLNSSMMLKNNEKRNVNDLMTNTFFLTCSFHVRMDCWTVNHHQEIHIKMLDQDKILNIFL